MIYKTFQGRCFKTQISPTNMYFLFFLGIPLIRGSKNVNDVSIKSVLRLLVDWQPPWWKCLEFSVLQISTPPIPYGNATPEGAPPIDAIVKIIERRKWKIQWFNEQRRLLWQSRTFKIDQVFQLLIVLSHMYKITMWTNRNVASTTKMISACCRQLAASRSIKSKTKCASLNKRPPHYNTNRFDVFRRRLLAASRNTKIQIGCMLSSCDFLIF